MTKLIPVIDDSLNQPSLMALLESLTPRIIACSGGIDSLLLATLAHRQNPQATVVAHAISPAVPMAATARVNDWAVHEGWNLHVIESGEFHDEAYLSNPVNRCYFCKTNLYSSLDVIADQLKHVDAVQQATLCSGANLDDLGEYRPGLIAASEKQVRHPYVEAGISKAMIRSLARQLNLPFAELPASPCLASRLYTGTRVTAERLQSVDLAESFIREHTGLAVVRCRIRDDDMRIEVEAETRGLITPNLLEQVSRLLQSHAIELQSIVLDAEAYRSGRAFLVDPKDMGSQAKPA